MAEIKVEPKRGGLGWLWAMLAGPYRVQLAPAGTPFPRRKAIAFYAGLLTFYIAVGSFASTTGARVRRFAHRPGTYRRAGHRLGGRRR